MEIEAQWNLEILERGNMPREREKATQTEAEDNSTPEGAITDPDAKLTAPTSDDVGEQTKAVADEEGDEEAEAEA